MMMKTPENSKLFTRWKNPGNGLESLILTERAAPVQQSFYYTHPSFTKDGRFLWLGCGYPPPGGMYAQQVLGVVDFQEDELRVYSETQFPTSRPLVDLDSGDVIWGNDREIWKRGPLAADRPRKIGCFPSGLVEGKLVQLATHPTYSPDGRSINLDARSLRPDGSTVSCIGDLPLDGGSFRLWQKFEGVYNHGLFSPTDSDLQMFAHEYWVDHCHEPFEHDRPYHRMWLIRRGEEARPILKNPVSHSGHEWWDADGKHVWYLHYGVGVKKVEVATGEETMKWPGALSHAHCDRTGRYLVADRMDEPHNPDCHVMFRDTLTGREVEIVNRGPLAPHLTKCVHLHPHPQFCLNDRYICYTTTIHDRVDIALVPLEELIDRTR